MGELSCWNVTGVLSTTFQCDGAFRVDIDVESTVYLTYWLGKVVEVFWRETLSWHLWVVSSSCRAGAELGRDNGIQNFFRPSNIIHVRFRKDCPYHGP